MRLKIKLSIYSNIDTFFFETFAENCAVKNINDTESTMRPP